MAAVPDSMQYILLMAACFIITLPLEFVLGARVYRRPLRLIQAVLITAVVFSIWDIVAIGADLWTYTERFTSGIILPFGLPLEELIFFLIIPLCAILTYEAVGRVLTFIRSRLERTPVKSKETDDA